LQRRKLRFRYHSRSKDERTERSISPQRIIYYRDNWYLDAWDDSRKALRTFSIDRIRGATEPETRADGRATVELDDHFGSSYGIFIRQSQQAGRAAILARARTLGRR